jgi:hypothetical protein
MHKIFYSWQSDTKREVNHFLIRDSLEKAIKSLDLDLELDEATRDQPGSRMIFATICAQVESCAIFVPDLTLVGQTYDGKKHLPNPNVLIEYGYALAQIGEGRIVPVMNAAMGTIENLPFDLRLRPIKLSYTLAPDATPTEQEQERDELSKRLQHELRLVFESGSLFHGLSAGAVRIVQHMVQQSESGVGGREHYEVEKLARDISIDAAETNRLLRQLTAIGYVERLAVLGTDAPPSSPTDLLFWDFDLLFRGENPRKDAETVAEAMLKSSGKGENCDALRQALRWDVRRINPALQFLVWAKLVLASNEVVFPLAVSYIKENENTEAFVNGLIDPSNLRTRRGF